MRDPNRIPKVLQRLQVFWQIFPDYRLGQLIERITREANARGLSGADAFSLEDDVLMKCLEDIWPQHLLIISLSGAVAGCVHRPDEQMMHIIASHGLDPKTFRPTTLDTCPFCQGKNTVINATSYKEP